MVSKWEIYLCSLEPVKGSEQKGLRPVLIVSNDAVNHSIPVSTALPFSSIKKDSKIYPTEVFIPADVSGLNQNSVVMIQQIRTVSHQRLAKKLSYLEDEKYRNRVLEALKEYFEY